MKLRCASLVAFGLFASTAFAQAIDVKAMEALSAKNNCTTCHTVDKPGPFPNHKKIAEKYKGQDLKVIVPKLVEKVQKGGSGTFGALPMPANSQVSKEDAEKLVRWFLSAK